MEALIAILGTVVTAMAGSIGYLYRDNHRLHKLIEAAHELHSEERAKDKSRIVWMESTIASLTSQIEQMFGPDSIQATIGVDFSGIIREWSPTATAMFFWKPREVIGRSFDMLIPGKYTDQHKEAWNKVIGGDGIPEAGPREVFILMRNGMEAPVTISLNVFKTQGRKIIQAVIRRRVAPEGESSSIGRVKAD